MKIEYKNYTIEDDKYGYVLSIKGIIQDKNSKKYGEEYIKEQIYPSTLERCIERIFYYEKMANTSKVTFQEYIDQQKIILEELKAITLKQK